MLYEIEDGPMSSAECYAVLSPFWTILYTLLLESESNEYIRWNRNQMFYLLVVSDVHISASILCY